MYEYVIINRNMINNNTLGRKSHILPFTHRSHSDKQYRPKGWHKATHSKCSNYLANFNSLSLLIKYLEIIVN